MKKRKRNEIEIVNKQFFLEYDKNLNEEEQIKSLDKEISHIKQLINKTDNKINNLKNDLYLTCDDLIENNNNENFLVIKTKANTKPNIKIISESEDYKEDNEQDNFGENFNFDLTNNMNNLVNESLNNNYNIWNINNQSSSPFQNRAKDENPIELFWIESKFKQNN